MNKIDYIYDVENI